MRLYMIVWKVVEVKNIQISLGKCQMSAPLDLVVCWVINPKMIHKLIILTKNLEKEEYKSEISKVKDFFVSECREKKCFCFASFRFWWWAWKCSTKLPLQIISWGWNDGKPHETLSVDCILEKKSAQWDKQAWESWLWGIVNCQVLSHRIHFGFSIFLLSTHNDILLHSWILERETERDRVWVR